MSAGMDGGAGLSRRGLLAGGGLVVAFALVPGRGMAQNRSQDQRQAPAPPPGSTLPGSLKTDPMLDAWIRVDPDGRVIVFTGKAELGQGIRTALIQLAAEELDLPPGAIHLVTADTGRTPDEGFTAGSHSMQDSGTAIQNAAAQVRVLLVAAAAERLGVPAENLVARGGSVVAPDGRGLGYGPLAAGLSLHVQAQPAGPGLKPPASFAVIGKPVPRVDIPAKVTGGPSYVQDMRPAGMLHARVVRPPGYGATLRAVDEAAARAMPGVVQVVRDGSFLAVVAEREWQAIKAMRALTAAAQWSPGPDLPREAGMGAFLQHLPARDVVVMDRPAAALAVPPAVPDGRRLSARYTRPYLMHGSIGPSCALALFQQAGQDGPEMTVWTHTQGVFPLRAAIAELVGLPPAQVRCIQVEGSGCYGHNAADDVAGDAALIARALPGRPIRLQWMREQEHRWEPYGPAMVTEVSAALDAGGRIADWRYTVWSNTHNRRPGGAGLLLAGQEVARPFTPPPPAPIPMPEGDGDRNSIPLYDLPSAHILYRFIPEMPLRVSALRGLGAHLNVFSIESFMDELAAAAGADPVAFRLAHLSDPRASDVVRMAAERFGWTAGARKPGQPSSGAPGRLRGRGFAFARYKNLGAYCAVALEVEVEHETGQVLIGRVVAATDSGQAVNPDGIRNQIEGAIVQSASWALHEAVGFEPAGLTSFDWSTYPILRFEGAPQSVEVHVIDRPGQPFLGTGEAGQGPSSAAIANAVADATGVRLRDLPLSAARVKAAIGV